MGIMNPCTAVEKENTKLRKLRKVIEVDKVRIYNEEMKKLVLNVSYLLLSGFYSFFHFAHNFRLLFLYRLCH